MDSRNEFYSQLAESLEVKAESLENSTVRSLREHFQGFEANVSAVYSFLIDKGLMQSDPYKHERSITSIQVPSSDPMVETDISHEISQRFSQYVSQWEFLVNIFHVSLETLSLKKIGLLMDLLDYIRWTDFSSNSSYQITRVLSGIVGRVSRMNDPMAGKIVSSSAAQLRDLTRSIKAELKTISEFLRERYKMRVREDLTNGMNIDVDQYRRKPISILENVKFEFSHRMKGLGWYKDFIYELLEEDYGTAAEELRKSAIARLKISTSPSKKTRKTEPEDKSVLLGILERMAKAGEPIRSTLVKMNENTRTIQERKRSIGERLSEILSSIFKKTDHNVVYEIFIKDKVTGAKQPEILNYTTFSGLAMRRARVLQDLLDRNSSSHRNASTAAPPQLMEYIKKNLNEMKSIHRTLKGLNDYFRSESVPPEIRGTMKGSTLNLKNLKLVISDSMKMLNQYREKKEEEAQLRKLGIED